MHSDLHLHLARATARDRAGRDARGARLAIRRAEPRDAAAVHRLAVLDEEAPLRGDVLLALADGRPVAAISLEDGRVAADPFAPTADAVELLQLRSRPRRPRRFARLRPGIAA